MTPAAQTSEPRTDNDFEEMLAGFDRIIHDKELQRQLLDAGLLVRTEGAAAAVQPASPDVVSVWIVVRGDGVGIGALGGVCAVYDNEADAYEDLDMRTGRGARPDLEAVYAVESWHVAGIGAQRRAAALPAQPAELDVERLAKAVHDTECGYDSHIGYDGEDPNPCGEKAGRIAAAYAEGEQE